MASCESGRLPPMHLDSSQLVPPVEVLPPGFFPSSEHRSKCKADDGGLATSQLLTEESPVCSGPVWSERYLLFKHVQAELIYMQYLSACISLRLQHDSESNNKKKKKALLISFGTTLLFCGG